MACAVAANGLIVAAMMTLAAIARGMWLELTGRVRHPSEEIRTNMRVAEDALYLAGRLKKESPEYNTRVLLEAARLLGATTNADT